MSITRAKSLESLYDECKDFDLVLVPDAPLASALNRCLDQPHFGPFAITPRRLAARRREQAEDRLAFLEVIEETDLDWKEASYAVGNILQCWEYQGTADAILEYEAFATEATRTAVDCIAEMDTTSFSLTNYTIDSGTSVAVVGIKQLTELECSILPPEYETVDPFTHEPFDHPPFRILDSPAAIVDAVLDTVTRENADDVGVVLDGASEYSSLVESALESADIPYYGGPGFNDEPHHRAFLQLLRSAHAGRDTRVGDVRPLLSQLGMSIDVEHDEKCLYNLDDPAVDWLLEFSADISTDTFEAVVEAYEAVADSSLSTLRDELATSVSWTIWSPKPRSTASNSTSSRTRFPSSVRTTACYSPRRNRPPTSTDRSCSTLSPPIDRTSLLTAQSSEIVGIDNRFILNLTADVSFLKFPKIPSR